MFPPLRVFLAPIAAIALSGAILIFGLSPQVPSALRSLNDKVLHACGYAALAFTSAEALAVLRWGPSPPFAALGYAVVHGATLEALQSAAPRRRAEWGDLLADVVGAILGVTGWWLWRRR